MITKRERILLVVLCVVMLCAAVLRDTKAHRLEQERKEREQLELNRRTVEIVAKKMFEMEIELQRLREEVKHDHSH